MTAPVESVAALESQHQNPCPIGVSAGAASGGANDNSISNVACELQKGASLICRLISAASHWNRPAGTGRNQKSKCSGAALIIWASLYAGLFGTIISFRLSRPVANNDRGRG